MKLLGGKWGAAFLGFFWVVGFDASPPIRTLGSPIKRSNNFAECPLLTGRQNRRRPLYVVRCTSRPFHFIFICVPAAVEAGESLAFAVPVALLELCVLTEAINFLGLLAAADADGIT